MSRRGRRDVQNVYERATTALQKGATLHDRGSPAEAVPLFEEALEDLESLAKVTNIALTGSGIAPPSWLEMARSLSREKAGEILGLALRGVNAARTLLASSLRQLHRYDEAIEVMEADAELRQSTGDSMGYGRILYLMAETCAEAGRLDDARRHYTTVLGMARNEGRGDDAAAILSDLSGVARQQGRYQEAMDLAEEALNIRQGMNDQEGVGASLTEVAGLLRVLGQYESTRRTLEDALAIARGLRHPEGIRVLLNSLGDLAFTEGKHEEALAFLEEALPLARGAGDVGDEGLLLANMGATHRMLGRLPDAERVLDQALQIARETGDLDLLRLASANRGAVHRDLGNPDAAAVFFEEVLAIDRRLGLAGDEAEALLDLAETDRDRGRLSEAADRYGLAIEAVERMRAGLHADELRTGYFSRKTDPYRRLISLLVQEGKVEEAVEVSERSRARAFLDLLSAAGQTGDPEIWGAGRIRRELLDAQTALLEYALDEDGGSLFVLRDDGVRAFPLPPAGQIADMVRRLRDGVIGLEDADRLPGAELYAAVLDREDGGVRAANLIADRERLIVVADGVLHHLPFELLVSEAGTYLIEEHDVVYAPSASALGLVLGATTPGRWPQDLVAFADPLLPDGEDGKRSVLLDAALERVRDGTGLGSLPATRDEVAAIASLLDPDQAISLVRDRAEDRYDGARVSLRLGAQADKESVVARFDASAATPSRFVHFSTHGLLDPDHPELSGLVFSPGPSREPFWQTFEIMGARVPADLVVLSACETGLGRLVGGEGVVGLSRAFLHAGARTLCVSLWKVPDVATASFMESFYGRLLAEGSDKASALRSAKREVLAMGGAGAHPFFWAPFVLVGAWGWTGER